MRVEGAGLSPTPPPPVPPIYKWEPLSTTLGAPTPSFIDESVFCLEATVEQAAVALRE